MTFPAYPDYRDSGVEWLGVVPEHWGVKPLRYLGRFRKGLTITKADLTDTGIPCLNYGEVHSLYPFEVNQDIQALKCVPAEYLETEPSSCISYGDFVFADTSEDLEGVGNFTHVSGLEPLFAGYHTIIYSLDSDVSSRFLAYCLESFAFRTQLRMGVKGVKVFSVTQEILRGGIAWLPTTAEQTQIALFLDHETARIDALIEEQQRLIELLKEKRQAVISHAVTKGLDPTMPVKDSGVKWLGEVPAHWIVSRVKNIASFITSGPRGWSDYIDESGEDIFLQSGDMDNRLNVLFDKAKRITTPEGAEGVRTRLQDGDVVVCITGANTGRVAVLGEVSQAAYVNQHLGLIRPYKLACSSRYLGYALSSSACQTYFNIEQYGLKEGLSLTDLAEAPLMVPPLAEQAQLVNVIENRLSNLDRLTADSEMTVELLQERRFALICAAVTGKIDVRGWQSSASAPTPELAKEAV